MKLDRWNGYNYLGYGLCLDWLERENESDPMFSRAEELDPNGYYTLAHIGMHYIALRDYAAAKAWFERSLKLEGSLEANPVARTYFGIVQGKLMEAATNDLSALMLVPSSGAARPPSTPTE
jgi:tetratricopeptide (TPR) repeat protein